MDLTGAKWRKSSRSGTNGGDCVEIAPLPTAIAVRDSKHPAGTRLAFTAPAWTAFLAEVKAGRLDLR